MESIEPIKPFEETIYKNDIENIAIDFADIALDDLTALAFENVSNAFLDLPVVKWATAAGKIGWSVNQAFSLKKQLVFIQNLQKGTVKPEAVEKRKKAISNREKWVEKEIETTVIYLERYSNVKKAVYHARMYRDLLNEDINYGEYEEYLTILDQLFIGDLSYLLEVINFIINNKEDCFDYEKIDDISTHFDKVKCARLQSLGLLEGIITSRVGSSTIDRYFPTDQGHYMYSVLNDGNDTMHGDKK